MQSSQEDYVKLCRLQKAFKDKISSPQFYYERMIYFGL